MLVEDSALQKSKSREDISYSCFMWAREMKVSPQQNLFASGSQLPSKQGRDLPQ